MGRMGRDRATKARGPRPTPTFGRALRTGGPPGQEAVRQQRFLDVFVLRPQRQGAEQLRVVGRAPVVEHVRQLQRLHAAPLPEHLQAGHAGSWRPGGAAPRTPTPPASLTPGPPFLDALAVPRPLQFRSPGVRPGVLYF